MARFRYQAQWYDGALKVIAGGTITVYLAGTTTLATIYAAETGGSAITGSVVTTASDGSFSFWVDQKDYPTTIPRQRFKVTGTHSDINYPALNWDNIDILPTPDFVYPEWWGAVGDGATDDSSAIQSAIDAVEAAGGGIVTLLPKVYAIGSTLTINNHNVHLRGTGSGHQIAKVAFLADTVATELKWTGGAGGTMLKHTATNSGDNDAVTGDPSCKGGGVQSIHLNGNAGTAAIGLQHSSVWGGLYEDLIVSDTTSWGIQMDVVANAFSHAERTSAHNVFKNILIRQWNAAAVGGGGIYLTGDINADAHSNFFSEIYIIHQNGIGLELDVADNNTFVGISFYRPNGTGTGDAIVLRSGTDDTAPRGDFARHNTFIGVQAGGNANGGRIRQLTGAITQSLAQDNYFILNDGNSAAGYENPIIGDATQLTYIRDRGFSVAYGDAQYNALDGTNRNLVFYRDEDSPTANDILGQVQWKGPDDGDNLTIYTSIRGVINVETDGAERGDLQFFTTQNGTITQRGYIRQGLVVGTPTDTDKGAGTINATAVYDDGLQLTGRKVEQVTPDAVSGGTIAVDTAVVDVQDVTNDADDWIVLPAIASVAIGHEITICCNAATNFELRTPAASNTQINGVDADGTNELLCNAGYVIKVTKVTDTDGWVAYQIPDAAGAVATIAPHA